MLPQRPDQTTASLVIEKDLYQKIIEIIGDPIFIKDRQHRLVMINDANCRALGKSRDQLLGLSDYDLFSTKEADIFRARDEKVFKTGEEDINEEAFTAPNAETKTVVTRKQRLTDSAGNHFIVGIFKDISALKNAEANLQKANEGLEEKIRERTSELERANLEMQLHLEQLRFLNEKGRSFARLQQREAVLAEIYTTFSGRFPNSPIQLIESNGDGIKNTINSRSLQFHLVSSLQFLDGLDSVEEREIVVENLTGNRAPLIPSYPIRVWIPFFSGAGFLGGVQIFLPKDSDSKIEEELSLLGTLSTQASVAWDNANHYLALGEKARMESELMVARKIQMHYVPETPSIPNFILHGVCLPALEIGGDYLDYFQNEEGDWIIVIADVCGKGVPAALMMTSLRSCLRSEGRKKVSPKELLTLVNRLLGAELEREKSFLTCLILILAKDGKKLSFCRAGHPHLVAFGSSQNQPEALPSKGIAMGMTSEATFRSKLEDVTLTLRPGDRFFAYTDGVDEAMDSENRAYGKDRLFHILQQKRESSPRKVVQDVLADVRLHAKGHHQYDDMTLLCFEKSR